MVLRIYPLQQRRGDLTESNLSPWRSVAVISHTAWLER